MYVKLYSHALVCLSPQKKTRGWYDICGKYVTLAHQICGSRKSFEGNIAAIMEHTSQLIQTWALHADLKQNIPCCTIPYPTLRCQYGSAAARTHARTHSYLPMHTMANQSQEKHKQRYTYSMLLVLRGPIFH